MISGFSDIFFGKKEKLAHGVGNFRRFDKSRHAVFSIIYKGDVIAEDVDFNRRIVLIGRKESTSEKPFLGVFIGVISKFGGGDIFRIDSGGNASISESIKTFFVGGFVMVATDEIIGCFSG